MQPTEVGGDGEISPSSLSNLPGFNRSMAFINTYSSFVIINLDSFFANRRDTESYSSGEPILIASSSEHLKSSAKTRMPWYGDER